MENWTEEFINCCNSWRIADAWTIRQQNLPEKIFKYRSVTERSLEDLKNDTVWLCSPEKYNDPYDSTMTVNIKHFLATRWLLRSELAKDLTAEEIEKIKTSLDPIGTFFKYKWQNILSRPTELPEDKWKEVIEKITIMATKSIDRLIENQLAKKLLFTLRGKLKICSFSSIKSSIIMWSHYAQNHEGFCIEYDLASLDEKDDRRASLFPIIYSEKLCDLTDLFDLALDLGITTDSAVAERISKEILAKINGPKPRVDPLKTQTILEKIKPSTLMTFMYKSTEWSYEQEWRLLEIVESPTPDRSYSMPTPSAIYLGARMTEENKKRICDIAASKNIDVYQMMLSGFEFKLYDEKMGVNIPESFLETEEWKLFREKLLAEFPESQSDDNITAI